MSRRHVSSSSVRSPNVQYNRLSQDESPFIDAQFKEKPVGIPWKPIIYAFILLAVGSVSIAFSALILTGHIHEQYSDRMVPLLLIGGLMFIPGAYHSYLAFHAFRGSHGFTFSDIPTYDENMF